jgi:site-specific DNA recombinase
MRGGKPPKDMYICNSRSKRVKKMIKDPNCKNKRWNKDELDAIVFGEIRKLIIPERIQDLKQERKKKTQDDPNKIDLIEREIDKLDEQISRFMDLYGAGTFTVDQVNNKVAPLNEQRSKLQKELDNLNAVSGRLSEEEALEIADSFAEILEHGDFNEIRATIELLISYIEIDNETIYIHWKFS